MVISMLHGYMGHGVCVVPVACRCTTVLPRARAPKHSDDGLHLGTILWCKRVCELFSFHASRGVVIPFDEVVSSSNQLRLFPRVWRL